MDVRAHKKPYEMWVENEATEIWKSVFLVKIHPEIHQKRENYNLLRIEMKYKYVYKLSNSRRIIAMLKREFMTKKSEKIKLCCIFFVDKFHVDLNPVTYTVFKKYICVIVLTWKTIFSIHKKNILVLCINLIHFSCLKHSFYGFACLSRIFYHVRRWEKNVVVLYR